MQNLHRLFLFIIFNLSVLVTRRVHKVERVDSNTSILFVPIKKNRVAIADYPYAHICVYQTLYESDTMFFNHIKLIHVGVEFLTYSILLVHPTNLL